MTRDIVELKAQDMSELSEHQLTALAALEVGKDQEDLGGSFQGSVKEWQAAGTQQVLGLCFQQNGEPVGMVLF